MKKITKIKKKIKIRSQRKRNSTTSMMKLNEKLLYEWSDFSIGIWSNCPSIKYLVKKKIFARHSKNETFLLTIFGSTLIFNISMMLNFATSFFINLTPKTLKVYVDSSLNTLYSMKNLSPLILI